MLGASSLLAALHACVYSLNVFDPAQDPLILANSCHYSQGLHFAHQAHNWPKRVWPSATSLAAKAGFGVELSQRMNAFQMAN
eukprot:1149801-Pelagomonas_calceolata.AAC.5